MLPTIITTADLHTLVPELFVCAAAFALLMVDLFLSPQRRGLTHFLALLVLLAAAVLTARGMADGRTLAFSGMFVRDIASDVLKMAMYAVSVLIFVYAKPYLQDRDLFKGEFYALILFALLGMMLMASAGGLVTLYLGLELLALSSYGLVAMDRDNAVASEAAMKYFILGSLASGLLLYGISMNYGVTLFLGSAPKLAAFGMAYRLLEAGVGPVDGEWRAMIAFLAALSLVIGNLLALVQTNFKRLLAYSTISHVGFLFMGLANASNLGYAAAMFYAISYAIMAAAAFAAIILLSRRGFESENVSDFRGLWQRNPTQALLILFVMASLAGVPPFLGFWAKLEVIKAALAGDLTWLAILSVVCAVIGAFYYLRVIRAMFFEEAEGDGPRLHADSHLRVMFAINAAALLVLGLFAEPVMHWCRQAFPA